MFSWWINASNTPKNEEQAELDTKIKVKQNQAANTNKKLSKQTEIKPTFYSVLLDVKGVELASTVDHVTVIEMNAIARLAGLNLLRKNRQISADVIV